MTKLKGHIPEQFRFRDVPDSRGDGKRRLVPDRPAIIIPVKLLNNEARLVANVWALVDTGATCSAISSRVAKSISLLPLGRGNFSSASGDNIPTNIYEAHISIFDPIKLTRVCDVSYVTCLEISPSFGNICDSHGNVLEVPVDVLLGMDILTQATFKLDRYTFHIDFKPKGGFWMNFLSWVWGK